MGWLPWKQLKNNVTARLTNAATFSDKQTDGQIDRSYQDHSKCPHALMSLWKENKSLL